MLQNCLDRDLASGRAVGASRLPMPPQCDRCRTINIIYTQLVLLNWDTRHNQTTLHR